MAKIHTTLTVDQNVIKQAKELGINISKALNDKLKTLISIKTNDLEGISIELEQMKRKKIIKEINALQQKLEICQDNITNIEQKQTEIEQERLENEKKRLEKERNCLNCGKIIPVGRDRNHKIKVHGQRFPKGMVCNECYYAADGIKIKGWG